MLRSARSPEDFRPLIGNNRFPRPATPRAVSRCSKTDRSKLTIPPRYSKFSPLFFSRKPANGSTIPFPAHPSENAAKKTRDTLPCVARESSYFLAAYSNTYAFTALSSISVATWSSSSLFSSSSLPLLTSACISASLLPVISMLLTSWARRSFGSTSSLSSP